MDKYIYSEKNGIWYELQGDYYLPCLKLPEESEVHIGIQVQRHRRYLKNHHKVRYINLLTSGKLNSYLADIDTQARIRFDLLITQMAEKEDISEQLKTQNQMAWVGAMNNIHNRAEEIVLQELIYGEDVV